MEQRFETAHSNYYFLLFCHFGRISAKTRTVGTFHQKMVKFYLEWPNFAQISQKSTSFWQKVRPNFGRDPTVRVLAEMAE
jgi:hypothetical protein